MRGKTQCPIWSQLSAMMGHWLIVFVTQTGTHVFNGTRTQRDFFTRSPPLQALDGGGTKAPASIWNHRRTCRSHRKDSPKYEQNDFDATFSGCVRARSTSVPKRNNHDRLAVALPGSGRGRFYRHFTWLLLCHKRRPTQPHHHSGSRPDIHFRGQLECRPSVSHQ